VFGNVSPTVAKTDGKYFIVKNKVCEDYITVGMGIIFFLKIALKTEIPSDYPLPTDDRFFKSLKLNEHRD